MKEQNIVLTISLIEFLKAVNTFRRYISSFAILYAFKRPCLYEYQHVDCLKVWIILVVELAVSFELAINKFIKSLDETYIIKLTLVDVNPPSLIDPIPPISA